MDENPKDNGYTTSTQVASAPPPYPVISSGFSRYPNTFRLTEMSRIKHELNNELDKYTRVVQKVLQMLSFHRYKRLILAKFVMIE